MPANPRFRIAAHLGFATALLTFCLIVIGSVVRTTGSGLACPDWPLCQGRLIPAFESHVLIEWSHRLVALLVSLSIVSLSALTLASAPLRARLGGLVGLLLSLLAAQVLLGALTVWKLLEPSVVSGHLGVALLIFSTLVTYARRARAEAEPARTGLDPRPPGRLAAFSAATVLTYLQALLGVMVSSRHAGLACPDWPTCFGEWLPPLSGLVGLQMAHRFGAYLLTGAVLVAATGARNLADPALRRAGNAALALVVLQVILGVSNVYLQTPVWLSALHLAAATALLGVLLDATLRLAARPRQAAAPAPALVMGAGEVRP